MRVAFMVLAEAASVGLDNKMSLLNGDIENVYADSVPVTIPFLTIVSKVELTGEESEQEHQAQLTIVENGASPKPLMDVKVNKTSADPATGAASIRLITTVVNMSFTRFGKADIILAMDGAELARQPLYIRNAKERPKAS